MEKAIVKIISRLALLQNRKSYVVNAQGARDIYPWVLGWPKDRLFECAPHAVQTTDICPRLSTRILDPRDLLVLDHGVPEREGTVRRDDRLKGIGIAQDAI